MSTRTEGTPSFLAVAAPQAGCEICGEERRSYLYVIRGLPVVRCPGCGLVSLHPRPRVEELARFYEREAHQDPRLLWTDDETERDAARRHLASLRHRSIGSGPILLVAPPDHAFAEAARSEGHEVARHLSVRDVEDGQDLGGPYGSAVVLNQLERSADPISMLKRIFSCLEPGGLLLISLPSFTSWPARYFADQWTEWRPENLFYFDGSTLQSLLLKVGFGDVWIQPDRRLYTLAHVRDRAAAFPRTALTRLIALGSGVVPRRLRSLRVRLGTSGIVVTARRGEPRAVPVCSIVVPVYNERETFSQLMDALLARRVEGMQRQIIVVESNSTDGTREVALGYQQHPEVEVILQDRPRGKGHAVRAGLARARGDIVLIQDADLEYDLNDYDSLLEPLRSYRALVVLGARHGGSWKMRSFSDAKGLALLLNLGHVFFTTLVNVLYRQRLNDPFTMFKVFRRDCLYGLTFDSDRFDFDFELVIKLVRKGYRPLEIPVNYRSRSFTEGKKVRLVRDPLTWIWAAVKYRFTSLSLPPGS
jgi:hypothetical protein